MLDAITRKPLKTIFSIIDNAAIGGPALMIPEWEKLTPYNQVRRRVEMYYGSRDPHTQVVLSYADGVPLLQEETWVPAIFTCFREIVDNALDELVVHGRGDRLDITYDAETLTFSVADNGRGLPLEWSDEHQAYAPTILLSSMFSGRNFKPERGESRGLNGIGAKGVNFCSEWFKVEVRRDKKQFIQSFAQGDELQVGEPSIWPTNSRKKGTAITCRLSPEVFPTRLLPESFVAARIYEIALCYPKLAVFYNGVRITAKDVAPSNDHPPILINIVDEKFRARFWLLPRDDVDDFYHTLVNGIPLFSGGTHIDAFRRGFYSGLLSALERENKRRKLTANRADISSGLLIYCIAECPNPNFDSQAKTRLINEHVGTIVRKRLDDPTLFKQIIREHPDWIDAIYRRCAARTTVKDDKEVARQAKRNLRQKIESLKDACSRDRSKCILFLAEGDSAISGLVKARDPEIHGGLPLRGKVLNVFGEPPKKIIENEALARIMNSIGLVPGQRVNRHALRYGKIAIACDADQDGANIRALLCNFFYTCWPELFDPEKPYIYSFDTPLIIAVKGKQRRYWYADDYSNFNAEKFNGWDITRAKGLAALVREDWQHILANPRVVSIVDDGHLATTLQLLFDHSQSDARKSWIGL
jgi:DNA gyrase/topoisomerase IV subunit B